MKLSDEEISEVADYLEAKLNVYYDLKKKEIIIITQTEMEEYEVALDVEPSDEMNQDYLKELEEEPNFLVVKDIFENSKDYFTFENMDSRESFNIMQEFADNLSDKVLQKKLYHALDRPKPFRNFKNELEKSEFDLDIWFDFKLQGYKDFVKRQIQAFNDLMDNE